MIDRIDIIFLRFVQLYQLIPWWGLIAIICFLPVIILGFIDVQSDIRHSFFRFWTKFQDYCPREDVDNLRSTPTPSLFSRILFLIILGIIGILCLLVIKP